MFIKVISVCLILLPCMAHSSVNKKMNEFFDNFGSSSNVSSAEVYNGQRAGYLTGGGISVRNRVMNTKLASINLPRFDAGCGGIDIYAGGFSFINHSQLVSTLKNIGSSAVGYAFLLGLETISPQTASTIKQLQSWANQINSLGINSCETASQLVGAVWPANTMASQQICRSVGNKNGNLFSDYINARHQCSSANAYDNVMEEMGQDKRYKSILADEYNIAWEAIQKLEFLTGSENKELAELFMTLMGTIVVNKDEDKSIKRYASKIDDESFLKVLIEGGITNGYKCAPSSKKCLILTESVIEIKPEDSWLGKVRTVLQNLQDKALADEEPETIEREFIAKASLPLYKIVNVLTAHKQGHCPVEFYQVANTVAMDLLIQYLREACQSVIEGCNQLRREQFFAEPVDQYLKELDRIQESIRYYEMRTMQQRNEEFQLMQKIELLEEKIASQIILNLN